VDRLLGRLVRGLWQLRAAVCGRRSRYLDGAAVRDRRGLNAAPPALLGKAAGTLNPMQQFGAVFGIAVVTAVFNSRGSLAGPAAATSGYRPALAATAGISVLGAIAATAIRRARAGTQPPALTQASAPGLAPALKAE